MTDGARAWRAGAQRQRGMAKCRRARGVPCFGLWVDGQRYFDYHHTAVDDLPSVNERELALGAAVVAYAASTLADQ